MDDESNGDREHELSDRDYAAAEKVLAQRNGAPAPGTQEYRIQRELIAISHSVYDWDTFALRNHLRTPRTSAERIVVAAIDEDLSLDEFIRRLRTHIERPVDILMIEEVSEAAERDLVDLGRFLHIVIGCATSGWPPRRVRTAERLAQRLVDRMHRPRLYKEELNTACDYFESLRNSLEPARCGSFTGTSAHEVCLRVVNHVVELWQRFRDIAARSRRSNEYTYATTASKLFYGIIEKGTIPLPNDLLALIELERRHALRALRRVAGPNSEVDPDRTIRASLVHIEAGQINLTTVQAPGEGAGALSSGIHMDDAPRADGPGAPGELSSTLDAGAGLIVEPDRRVLNYLGGTVEFTSKQRMLFDLLHFLVRRRGRIVRKGTLCGPKAPWHNGNPEDETINSAVGRLRDVLRPNAPIVAAALHTDTVDDEIAVRFDWPPKSE